MSVRGWNDEEVLSDARFGLYRSWFEHRIKETTKEAEKIGIPLPRFINATEGGSYIKGMEHLSLAKVWEENNE